MGKRLFIIITLTVGTALLLFGCEACPSARVEPSTSLETHTQMAAHDKFRIDHVELSKKLPRFSFRSQLLISKKSGETTQETREHIEIEGEKNIIHLKKKFDDYDFMEIVKSHDDYVIKNQNGLWRSGNNNKSMYESLITDAFGVLEWSVRNLVVDPSTLPLRKNGSQIVVELEGKDIDMQAPIVKQLQSLAPDQFKADISSSLSLHIELDNELMLPRSAKVDAQLGNDSDSIVFSLTMSVQVPNRAIGLTVPKAQEYKDMHVPVSIRSRFNHIIENK